MVTPAAVLGAMAAGLGATSAGAGAPPDAPGAVVARALQVSEDTGYLPVQSHGRWVLAGPGSWLQPTISTTSTPWRWSPGRCTVLDASLIPGLETFVRGQIAATFAGAEQARLLSALDARVGGLETVAACVRPPGAALTGPPGPIRDETTVTHLSVAGATATATAVVHVTDWQGGVTAIPTAGGGRRVGWAVVRNVVDATYDLTRRPGGRWRVVALRARFAPGGGP